LSIDTPDIVYNAVKITLYCLLCYRRRKRTNWKNSDIKDWCIC